MRRLGALLGGLAALALAFALDARGEQLLSAHVAQHLLLGLVAPALLLCSAPARLALLAWPSGRATLARALRAGGHVRPPLGFALFAAVALGAYWPPLFSFVLRHPLLHALEHAAFFATGLLFLAPLIAADPLPHRPSPLARFCWLMGAMATMAVPGALLSFDDRLAYGGYRAPARALHVSALADQHLAGAVMWVGGGVLMLALALALVLRAMREEERRQRRRELYAQALRT